MERTERCGSAPLCRPFRASRARSIPYPGRRSAAVAAALCPGLVCCGPYRGGRPRHARKPIGVATYRIVKRLPKELKGQLPSPEEIARLLEDVG
jgi:hypothetical protein